MERLVAYLPVLVLVLIAVALLFATAADRKQQLASLVGSLTRTFRASHASSGATKRRFSLPRIVFWVIVLFLLSYLWAYQRAQDAIAAHLVDNGIDKAQVGSLIIPWSAFFQSHYTANAGFSRSKKRTRADVSMQGYLWSGLDAHIDESGLAKINKITGKKFVFSYLTDVKLLRPAINRHMDLLVRGRQIAQYEIETFDNRGPYIIVALNEKSRGKDINQVATALAEGLHTNLIKTNQLKVNQVVIKVVDPEPYLTEKIITVIGRGKAGSY